MSTGTAIPTKYGGYATFPTYIASHGIYDVFYNTIYQDQWGVIRQQRSGRPSQNDDVIVGGDRNPSSNGFALVGWGDNIQGGRPLELRVYWVNTSGKIYERCFSANGGSGAVWYDGSLQGQFTAASYSSIAANSSGGAKTHVYFQEETGKIRELYKEGKDTFDPFVLVTKERPAALKGTCIATDSNDNGATEVYYQSLSHDWVIDGAGVQPGFKPHDEFPYRAGAPIAVAGSVAQGHARVITVNKEGRIVITTYDKPSLTWKPSAEMIRVQSMRQICVRNHPAQTVNPLFRHGTTIIAGQTNTWSNVTFVGFTDTSFEGWDVLPVFS